MSNRFGLALVLAAVMLAGLVVWMLMGGEPADPMRLDSPSITEPEMAPSVFSAIEGEAGPGDEPASIDSAKTVRVKLHSRIKPTYGVVLEEATGLPVEGVYVVAQRRNAAGSYDYDDSADTDAAGVFRLMKLKDSVYEIMACHADYEEAVVEARPGDEHLVIHLPGMPEYSVYGTVQDDQGARQPDISVILYSPKYRESSQTRTSAKGMYEFRGIPPGAYRLSTELPRDSVSPSMYFTEEGKTIEIVDRDLCIHFITDSGDLAWKGVLHDFEGNPVSGAEIQIDQVNGSSHDRSTNAEGAFYFSRLEMGRYRVRVELPGGQVEGEGGGTPFNIQWAYYQLDDVVFDKPGVHEKDIRLSGAVLSGVVIDERTGAPVSREKYRWLQVKATLLDGRHFYCRPGQDARFCFKGVPSGHYTFRAGIHGRGYGYLEKVQVEEGGVLGDLRVPIPRSGVLALHLQGFHSKSTNCFTIRVEGPHAYDFGYYSWNGNGDFNREFTLEVGTWRLILGGTFIDRIERDFTIYDERTSEITFNGQDYRPR